MLHPAPYIPEEYLKRIGEVDVFGKTLITVDASLTPLGIAAYWALTSAIFFTILYKSSRHVTPLLFKGYRQLSNHDQRDWDSRYGNIIYSAYIAYMAGRLVLDSDLFWAPGPELEVKRTSPDTYAALGVSVGFFLYELFITIKYWMGGAAMVLHHIGSLTCVAAAVLAADAHCFTLWMLSTEFTTPFIALRFLLDKAGLKTHPLYLINGMAILVAWTVARIATFVPFFATVWRQREQLHHLNPLSQFLVYVFPVVLASLNIWWYSKIIAGVVKAFKPVVAGPKPPAAKPAAKQE